MQSTAGVPAGGHGDGAGLLRGLEVGATGAVVVQHQFESADSVQTLAEGLAEYLAANPSLKRGPELLSPQARAFFASHDIVHVVYGCGTSLPDEAIVKLASIFGTTGGLGVLRGYLHHEALDIYRKLPLGGTLLALATAPCLIVRTLWRCSRQFQRWPWTGYEPLLGVPLRDIRSQYGITVAHGRGAGAA